MAPHIPGIHHVTAIASSPWRNVDFYARVLGLRLVKRTVNFDDPSTYHLYYGDEVGHPGSVLTFFPWPDARPGRVGTGQVTTTSFVVPEGSLDYWRDRLSVHRVDLDGTVERFDDRVVGFRDPDDLRLELVASAGADAVEPWTDGPVPPEHAVRGFHGATLTVEAQEATVDVLEMMGFEPVEEHDRRCRYRSTADVGSVVDVVSSPHGRPGYTSPGTVHHIAFRVGSEDEQVEWRRALIESGHNVTPIIDRHYFRSIYFREPGGVLFEIATESPGFTVDEDEDALGTGLRLPPWLEGRRGEIEAGLPAIPTPNALDVGGG